MQCIFVCLFFVCYKREINNINTNNMSHTTLFYCDITSEWERVLLRVSVRLQRPARWRRSSSLSFKKEPEICCSSTDQQSPDQSRGATGGPDRFVLFNFKRGLRFSRDGFALRSAKLSFWRQKTWVLFLERVSEFLLISPGAWAAAPLQILVNELFLYPGVLEEQVSADLLCKLSVDPPLSLAVFVKMLTFTTLGGCCRVSNLGKFFNKQSFFLFCFKHVSLLLGSGSLFLMFQKWLNG